MNNEFYAVVAAKGKYLVSISDSQGETAWFELTPDIATENERVQTIF
jgi:hypothetical protein